MPVDIAALAAPEHTALLVFEMQRGVVGDLHRMPALDAATVAPDLIPRVASLADAARDCGVRVVHCVVEWRADRAGMIVSSPLLAVMTKNADHVLAGAPTSEIVPELAPYPQDLVCARASGVAPFTATNLDHLLRSDRVRTVVAVGAGLTVGLLGLAIEAIGLGYSVVIPADGFIDTDPEYAQTVWDKTFPMLVTRTTIAALVDCWSS
jgi:nicotinamidase-related amidase